jgi:hypothetical protein
LETTRKASRADDWRLGSSVTLATMRLLHTFSRATLKPTHAGLLLAVLAFTSGARSYAGPPKRTDAEKISDQGYKDRVTQDQQSRDMWKGMNESRSRPGPGGSGASEVDPREIMRARCAELASLAAAATVDFMRLQGVILPEPPGWVLSRWNGVEIPGREMEAHVSNEFGATVKAGAGLPRTSSGPSGSSH